jgi:hypothetical protein
MDLPQKIAKCDGSNEQVEDIKRSIVGLATSCSQQVSLWNSPNSLTSHASYTEPTSDL